MVLVVALADEIDGGAEARELPEVVDEVRLVEVAARRCYLGSVDLCRAVHHPHAFLEGGARGRSFSVSGRPLREASDEMPFRETHGPAPPRRWSSRGEPLRNVAERMRLRCARWKSARPAPSGHAPTPGTSPAPWEQTRVRSRAKVPGLPPTTTGSRDTSRISKLIKQRRPR